MTRLVTVAQSSRRSPKIRRKSTTSDLIAGAVLGGAVGFIVGSIMSAARSQGNQAAPSIAGVSLEGVDLTRPFAVDLSIPENAEVPKKIAAYQRAQYVQRAFEVANPNWRVDPNFHPSTGKFVLVVYPATNQSHQIAQRFLTNA
jgi:hypothetical protein